MPTYEYRCTSCRHELEAVQSFSDPSFTTCPQCGQDALRKVFGSVGVVFKGSGFYRNDSRSESRSGTASAEGSGGQKPDKADNSDRAGSDGKGDSADKGGRAGSDGKSGKDGSAKKDSGGEGGRGSAGSGTSTSKRTSKSPARATGNRPTAPVGSP